MILILIDTIKNIILIDKLIIIMNHMIRFV